MTAFFVIATIERYENVLTEFRALFEDRIDHVRAGIGGARRGAVAVEVEDVLDQKAHVAQGELCTQAWSFLRQQIPQTYCRVPRLTITAQTLNAPSSLNPQQRPCAPRRGDFDRTPPRSFARSPWRCRAPRPQT